MSKSNKKSNISNSGNNKKLTINSKDKVHKQESSLAASAAQASDTTMPSHQIKNSASPEYSALIWLDANLDESNEFYHDSLIKLRRIAKIIYTYNLMDKCVDFFSRTKHEKVFMIVSGTLGQEIVPRLHPVPRLAAVYIYCQNRLKHAQWSKKWMKVKGVYTDLTPIYESLKLDMRYYDRNSSEFNFAPTGDILNLKLNQLEPSFMYTRLLKEIILKLKLKLDEQYREDFAKYCREMKSEIFEMIDQPEPESEYLKTIAKFESEYIASNAVWWYSRHTFIYKLVNKILRNQTVRYIIKMSFFIRDLHEQIQLLYNKQCRGYKKEFTVYRGLVVSKNDLEKMNRSALIGFNGFLSTSRCIRIALNFTYGARMEAGETPILFTIEIDPSERMVPFADVERCSDFANEKEVLFSMHAVFRIVENEFDKNKKIQVVTLKPTSEDDPQLTALTNRIRVETQGESEQYQLGVLLIKLGEFRQAEEVFEALQEYVSNEAEKALLYFHLGNIKYNQTEYAEAIEFYKKTIDFYVRNPYVNEHNLASTYNNMGLIYDSKHEYQEAKCNYTKALEIYQRIKSETDPVFATCFNNIGTINYRLKKYSEALENFKKALDFGEANLPENHPHIAACCSNIGMVHECLKEYSQALSFYKRALEIAKRGLPSNHPSIELYEKNLDSLKKKNCK
ncbi:unnamed protein product [Rotaria magnacalcarata]|uniref:Uncharacterized protein n=1 Tax=Rotaria magnacalcarata TaxID=392030 RepID=A0A816HJL8_9BILA|nr:unnamed protein product [Rotaria magnacalcarata]CAF1686463.1 unnamed protein product [Rotaria magnacalcarata]CAF2102266.1 unnamed protein product [Rotaria magnacalcarata]CAF3796712.1 unnamed protein product [Rotaria magnacalcarata]CAF3808115.1 unnamed protein product [Rotaria magnacalcarata]